MKKQILILFIFLVSTVTIAFAQNPPVLTNDPTCPTPIAVTCLTPDALHPVPGNPYTYQVSIPTPLTGTKTYNWFVTQDQNFINAGALTTTIEAADGTGLHIQAAGQGVVPPNGYYNNTANGTDQIDIVWKSFTHNPATPVFLVIHVTNSDCATDNIRVYMIQPLHAFTLDLANLATDGTAPGDLYPVCVAPVAGAIYNTTTLSVDMDFGINYAFYAVTAANFTDSWMPSFEPGGAALRDSRVVTAVDWAYPTDAQANTNWHTTTAAGGIWTSTDPVEVQAAGVNTVGQAGECIVVRVTIENNQVETLVAENFTLAVDGIMLNPGTGGGYTTATFGDIHFGPNPSPAPGDPACPWYDGFTNDVITQVLSPRPNIVDETDPDPDDNFVPDNGQ